MRVNVTVKYRLGHSYAFVWVPEPQMYCPGCGAQQVWRDDGPGDVYDGQQHACIACGKLFSISGPWAPIDDEQQQPIDQIRAALK